MVVSYRSCENEICEEEEDALAELVWLPRSLSARIDKLKANRVHFSFEESTKDFPFLGAYVLIIPTHDGEVEDSIAVDATYSSPNAPTVSNLNKYIVVYLDEKK